MGFMMYLVIFIYGSMVMRSVMEEKLSRIVEVMMSSVKPINLMMGKLIGVGGVGLTQLAVWAFLIPTVLTYCHGPHAGVDPSQMPHSGTAVSPVNQESFDSFSLVPDKGCFIQSQVVAHSASVCYFLPGRIFYLLIVVCSDGFSDQ
jgi:ABC-2 type transport system permease protein